MIAEMKCDKLQDGVCAVAARLIGLVGLPRPHDTTCNNCTSKAVPPQDVNEVTVRLALEAVHLDPKRTELLLALYGRLLPGSTPKDDSVRLDLVRHGYGPGSQLWRLLEELGIEHQSDCQCLSHAEQMNAWGLSGCREHRDEIVAWMRQGQDRFGWQPKLMAAARAVATGLAFRLNPFDLFPDILDEAIRRAEVHRDSLNHASLGK